MGLSESTKIHRNSKEKQKAQKTLKSIDTLVFYSSHKEILKLLEFYRK